MSNMDENEDVQLVFRQIPTQTGYVARGGGEKTEKFVTTLKGLANLFKGFQIDSIELWLEGGAKTGKITELFVSADGKGGCRITLKPE